MCLGIDFFSIFFGMTLKQVTDDLDDDDGVYVRYRMNGCLFNLLRLQAQTKTNERLIMDFLFADDADLIAHKEHALQRVTSSLAARHIKLCCASHLALRTPRGCVTLTSGSRKLRLFTILSREKNTDHSMLPMAMSN